MPKTRKTVQPKNLSGYDVYIEDTSENSVYFNVNNLPKMFTGGRNSFLLGGSPYIKKLTTLQIEILDSRNRPVYLNPVRNYVEGNSRLISVEIVNDITPGYLTIIVLGILDKTADGKPIPPDWQDKYNVRWTKKILTEPSLKNYSPIRLSSTPRIDVTENRFFNVATSSYTEDSVGLTSSISVIPDNGKLYGIAGYLIETVAPATFSAAYENTVVTGSLIIGSNTASLYLPITNILNSNIAFSKNTLLYKNVNNEKVNNYLFEPKDIVNKLYLSGGVYPVTIDGISTTIRAQPILRFNKLSAQNTNIPISYANIRLSDITTVSGEIYKFKVYNKVTTNFSDYKLIAEVPVITSELLVSSSIRGNVPIGDFYLSPTASTNWYADTLKTSNNVIYSISGSLAYYKPNESSLPYTFSVNDTVLLKSVFTNIPIDGNKFADSVSSSGYFIGTKQPKLLFPNTEYTLELSAYYRKTSGSVTLEGLPPNVDIYLIGTSSNAIIDNNPLGQKVGTLNVLKTQENKWFERQQFNFYPKLSVGSDVYVRVVVSNGFWNFSDISIKPASDATFSPDECQFLIPNTEYFNENLQYKIEFVDINGNSTDVQVISTPTYFSGSSIDLGILP